MKRYKTVDAYIAGTARWQGELIQLRKVLHATELVEDIKWGAPCYTFNGKNVVGMAAFKDYFGLWFHQGALLKDGKDVLINAQEGTTRALRQWRMKSAKEIKTNAIKAFVKEAIQLVRDGRSIGPQKKMPVVVPPELQKAMRKSARASDAFRKLTPGLMREYAEYISSAKRDETIQRRIERILPMIAAGKGLNDKYR